VFSAIWGGANSAALLVSHEGDGAAPGSGLGTTPLFTESVTGVRAVWARDIDLNSHDFDGDPNTIRELDGIEVWGADGLAGADSNRYSLFDDGATGISVYTASGAALISQATIATSLGIVGDDILSVDLDGLMTQDDGDNTFETGERIIFSIRPITLDAPIAVGPFTGQQAFDGGEIFQWQAGDDFASFLIHGGHVWDTDFVVTDAFGVLGENIDGIEAIAFIPEPAALGVFGLLGMAMAMRRRR
jgi:hypothetical protein